LCCAPANRPAAEPLDRSAVANFELARSHRIAIDLAGVGDGASEHAGSQPPGSFEAETGCALEGTVPICYRAYAQAWRRADCDATRLKGDHPVNRRKFHEIWIEQCDAAQEIKLRYGLKAAFDYIVAEKLLNFTDAAASDPEFARELPRFIARVKGLFTPQEIRTQLDRIGHELREYDADIEEGDNFSKADELREEDELIIESPAAAAERARQFATIRELLTVAELGTS